jgi:hypothetical protein
MSDPVDALILDLLEWVGTRPRPYAEVMDAWRTSCPRLPVWEEANARGLLTQVHEPGRAAQVLVTPAGLRHMAATQGRRHAESRAQRGAGSV